MKWWQIIVLFFAGWLMWLVNDRADTQEHRITQLECALAQAHSEADTLEAVIESLEQSNR